MNLPLLVTVVNKVLVVEGLDLVVELTSMGNTVEVDEFTWNGTSNWFTLWNITLSGWKSSTEELLKRFALFVQTVALDTEFVLEFGAEWDELLSEHWDKLLGILPLADVIVDLVEEGLTTDAEVFQVTLVLVAGTITSVGRVTVVGLPWATSNWFVEDWL